MKFVKYLAIGLITLVVAVFSLVWLLSPAAVRMAAKGPLADVGLTLSPDSVVRLNLFNSSVAIQNFVLLHNDTPTYSLNRLQIEYSLHRLFFKELYIEKVELDGMALLVSNDAGAVSVAGVVLPGSAAEDEDSVVDAPDAGSVSDPNRAIAVSVPQIRLQNLKVTFENLGHAHELEINELLVTDTQFNEAGLSTELMLDAQLDGMNIDLNSRIQVSGQDVQSQLDVQLNNLTPQSVQYLLPENMAVFEFDSDLKLSTEVSLNEGVVTVTNTRMNLELNSLNVQEQRVTAGLKRFAFALSNVAAQFNPETGDTTAQGEGTLQLTGLSTAMTETDDTLLNIGAFDSGTIAFDVNNQDFSALLNKVSLESLVLSQVASADRVPAMLTLDSITLKDVSAGNQMLSIAGIELGAGRLSVIRNDTGEVATLVDTSALVEPGTDETGAGNRTDSPVPEAPAPVIRLGELSLISALEISIEDQSNNTPFAKVFELTKADIRSVDSSQSELKTTFDVALRDADYFTLQTDGWIQLFSPQVNLAMTTTVREFPMNEVAPYLKDSLGFEVKSGQLDADISADIVDDQLDSDVVLLMRGANFSASETSEEGSNFIGQTAIPLNVALNMLKDGDGNIELKIPVNGDINDPSFGMQYVLGLVVKKVVLAQAKNYLISTLVPYAKVVSVAVVAGEQALKVRFEDLPYAENQIELQPYQTGFAAQLATLMTDKPDMTVNVCAVATATESVAAPTDGNPQRILDASAIAAARGQAFKNYLVSHFELASSRLLVCSPQVDAADDAVPRIEFNVL